jgi:hypothetical protein
VASHHATVLDANAVQPLAGVLQDLAQVSKEPNGLATIDRITNDLRSGMSLAHTSRRNKAWGTTTRSKSSADILDCLDLTGPELHGGNGNERIVAQWCKVGLPELPFLGSAMDGGPLPVSDELN